MIPCGQTLERLRFHPELASGLRRRRRENCAADDGPAQQSDCPCVETTSEPLATDPQLVASMLEGTMIGAERGVDTLRDELIFIACAYVDACSARALAR